MRLKKKTNLIILILIFGANFGFLSSAFERTVVPSDHVFNYLKLSTDSITITRPNCSCSWKTGTNEWIYYKIEGTAGRINISLYKDSILEMEIDSYAWGTGKLLWTNISSDLITSNLYQIKISDYNNPQIYDISDFFEISNPNDNPTFSGYNLYIIIGSICIVSLISATCIIIILKRKKH